MEINRSTNKTQVAILAKFIKSEGLSYSQGKPGKISNDDYKYHLTYLLKQGFLEKHGVLYSLTQAGKISAMHLDAKGVQQEKFWVHVSCYVERNQKGMRHILLQRKLKHPYFGDVFAVAGKVHTGELLEDAASRKFLEETGLSCTFKTLGTIRRVRKDVSGKVLQDSFFYVCYGTNPSGRLIKRNVFGDNFWCSYDEAVTYYQKNYSAGEKSTDIIRRFQAKNHKPFFFHEEITLGTPLP